MSIIGQYTNDYERADVLVNMLVDRATGGDFAETHFQELRNYFVNHTEFSDLLPAWYPTKRSANQYWQFIKNRYSTYAERREFLWNEFERLLHHIESGSSMPAEEDVSASLEVLNSESVNRTWKRILFRLPEDPEGAITLSRTLMESVCKHILDDRGVSYDRGHDLPTLYRTVAVELNLAPEQHQEEIFKQILGGCTSVVNGLGAVRNRLGDAHGDGRRAIRPKQRHANLAVNVGSSMALFLLETHESKT